MLNGLIAIEGLHIFAYHGYYDEERKLGKEFILDIYVHLDIEQALVSDHIRDTINYEQIFQICVEEMKISSKLLEQVAMRIGQKIKNLSSVELKIKIRISKPSPPLPGQIDRFFVEYEC